MVTRFGMSEKLGPLAYRSAAERAAAGLLEVDGKPYSEETARLVDGEVKRLVERARERALGILRAKRRTLEAITDELVRHETLQREDLERLVEVSLPFQDAERPQPRHLPRDAGPH
jgi:cell division protease FtsH